MISSSSPSWRRLRSANILGAERARLTSVILSTRASRRGYNTSFSAKTQNISVRNLRRLIISIASSTKPNRAPRSFLLHILLPLRNLIPPPSLPDNIHSAPHLPNIPPMPPRRTRRIAVHQNRINGRDERFWRPVGCGEKVDWEGGRKEGRSRGEREVGEDVEEGEEVGRKGEDGGAEGGREVGNIGGGSWGRRRRSGRRGRGVGEKVRGGGGW